MKALTLLAVCLLAALSATAQTGTVTVTAPAPGKFVASAGAVACTVAGNAVPATAVVVSCQVGGVAVPAYTIPLPANTAYTFDHRLNGDAVTVILQSSATGAVTWQAAATPNGGTAGSGSGSF